jgi:hypothetical protein
MLHKTFAPIEDDTEEAPWMVMGTPQYETVEAFASGLRRELRFRRPPLFVAVMLPIRYRLSPQGRVEQLAPDVMVAPVPIYPRSSYALDVEGVPPGFVLEVMSAESRARDLRIKPERYAAIGIREYALFAPEMPDGHHLLDPPLQGYRLDSARQEYVRWEPDAEWRLYSEELDLWLTVRDGIVRAQRADGSLVPTFDEERQAREAEAGARQELEAEVARLRAELQRRPDTKSDDLT